MPWHLTEDHLDATAVWPDYIGRGVSVGVFDDGVQAYGTRVAAALSAQSVASSGFQGIHGTAVAGLIAAQPGADGSVSPPPLGVAYGATLTVADSINGNLAAAAAVQATAKTFDVVNDSWGWTQAFYADRHSEAFKAFFEGIEAAAVLGRDGLGTSQVVAAGNGRATGGDANLSNFTNDRHVITVAATTSEHLVARYANGGASVLVAAGSSGGTQSLTTTDVAGSRGYSDGSVTTSFGGTSGAAPQVTGVVALMLEANPDLGWRDIRDILACSARQIDATTTVSNGARAWNGGGFLFSNDTGFGEVDARAAVRLAETWTAQSTSANELHLQSATTAVRTLADNATIEYQLRLAAGLNLETVQLTLAGRHGRVTDLEIELVSPSGTIATLLSHRGESQTGFSGWTFGANAFLGEDSGGLWTLRIRDTVSGVTGNFSGVTLDAYGSAASVDSSYIFTDAFANLGSGDRGRILDAAGHDTINAAAVSGQMLINLQAGSTSWIAGRTLTLGPQSQIVAAFGGDGDDAIIGNDLGVVLRGGRGNDVLVGGAGDDILDGGEGIDTAVLHGNRGEWTFSSGGDGQIVASHTSTHERDVLTSIERLQFADGGFAIPLLGQGTGPWHVGAEL